MKEYREDEEGLWRGSSLHLLRGQPPDIPWDGTQVSHTHTFKMIDGVVSENNSIYTNYFMPQDVTKYLPFKVGAIPRKAESTEVKPSSASSSSDGSAAVGVRQGENVEGTEG